MITARGVSANGLLMPLDGGKTRGKRGPEGGAFPDRKISPKLPNASETVQ